LFYSSFWVVLLVWIFCDDVSENSFCSIFIGLVSTKK
jgi:hypothetical protein